MLRLVSMVWENKLKKVDSNSRISSSTSSIDLRLTYLDRQAYRTTDNPGLVRLKISSSEGLRQLSLVGLSVSSLVARRQAASIGVVLPGDMQASYACDSADSVQMRRDASRSGLYSRAVRFGPPDSRHARTRPWL